MDLTQTMKESTIYQIYHEPENFVKKDEINCDESSKMFIQGILSSYLDENGVYNVIQKKPDNDNTSKALIQSIFSGEAFNQVINFHYSYGEQNVQIILNDENIQKQFILERKKSYAKILGLNPNDIIISRIREGGSRGNLSLKGFNSKNSYEKNNVIQKIREYEESQGAKVYDINFDCLLSFCKINERMFDHRYDQLNDGWERGGKRGPPGYEKAYDPPIGYKGYALNLKEFGYDENEPWIGMDNSEGEWYIAYHGTSGNVVKNILNEGFKKGQGQWYVDADNINPLTKAQRSKVGEGVYCSQKISEADSYTYPITFNQKKFKFVFMLRVNPYKIRICKGKPDYWVFEGESLNENTKKKFDDEVRPYRILLKEVSK